MPAGSRWRSTARPMSGEEPLAAFRVWKMIPLSTQTAAAAIAATPRPSPQAARRRTGHRLPRLATALLASLTVVEAASPQTLPYIPTTILVPEALSGYGLSHQHGFANDTAYIFTPSTSSSLSVDLLALNVSSTLKASSLSVLSLSSSLPFLDGSTTTTRIAFTPSLLSNGTIAAYVGGCASPNLPAVWTLTPPNSTLIGPGATWMSHSSHGSVSWEVGPSLLGGAVSFSTQLEPEASPASVYTYGGMCPSNTTETSWTKNAYYSNQMVKLSPLASGAYNVSPITSKGPPVAEAGFSFTALTPSISNRSGVVTQQANYVLLGGHTRSAFVNISTAALWSLPEEVWSFVDIQQPAAATSATSANTELAVKKGLEARAALPSTVDSRSGHSAVLSGDGSSLVILGGWVGSISQAAQPQLAVLAMGTTLDSWKWTIPTAQPSGPGIFGHGAALLPGNVMVVYGGYSISSSSTTKLKARQAGASGGVPMFLNLTSMTWANEYTNPVYASSPSGQQAADSSSSSKNRDIGLGVGLGVGLAVLIAVILIAFFVRRRQRRKKRHARDSAMRALAQDANMFLPDDEMAETDHDDFIFSWDSHRARDWYHGGGDAYARGSVAAAGGGGSSSSSMSGLGVGGSSSGRSLGYESLRGSRVSPTFYPPAPARKPVNPRNARGLYVGHHSPSASGDNHPVLAGPGEIHPIYEADEDEFPEKSPSISPDSQERDLAGDPFLTPVSTGPPGGAIGGGAGDGISGAEATMSGGRGGQDQEVQDWVSDIDTTDAVLSARIGPHSTTTVKGPAVAAAAAVGAAAAAASASSGGRLSPTRRASVRSKPGLSPSSASFVDEEGRTASNLSDSNRSAFSYAVSQSGSIRSSRPGTSAGIVALATAAAAKDDDRRLESSSGSSSVSTSGNSFNTARSSFAALQAEGPTLLAGATAAAAAGGPGRNSGGDDGSRPRSGSLLGGVTSPPSPTHEEDEDLVPGSPSKSKARRSWFGSLRRVFSGGSGPGTGETSRNESPSSFLEGGGGGGGDYEPRPAGLGGMLLRRKQGREAWEAAGDVAGGDAGVGSSSAAAGGPSTPGGSGGHYRSLGAYAGHDDDWDVERAVESRLIQVMFSVPKEKLRVVNADIEREEEVEIVDPDDHDDDDEEEEEEEGEEEFDETRNLTAEEDPMPAGLRLPPRRTSKGKGKEKEVEEETLSRSAAAGGGGGGGGSFGIGDEFDPFWDGPSLEGGGLLTKLTPEMVRVPTPLELKGKTLDDQGNIIADENTPCGSGARDTTTTTIAAAAASAPPPPPNTSTTVGQHKHHPGDDSRLSADEPSSTHVIMTAEAVRLLRRQPTRVLEMVENIEREESRSRNNTPGHSPARSSGGGRDLTSGGGS